MPPPISFACAAETQTPNYRTTWGHRAAIADRVRQAVRAAVPERPVWPSYAVAITRVGPNKLDDDNLVSACKAARDELAAWLELDDADPRLSWSYDQRKEQVRDESPRPRRILRTWIEVTVSEQEAAPIQHAPPPRLEREKPRPDVRVDATRPPLRRIDLPGGLAVELALAPDGTRYIRVCKHYVQQGHAWRTVGVAVPIPNREAVIEALRIVLDE